MQGPGRRGLFLDFSGYFAPDSFAGQVTAARQLLCPFSDSFVGVEPVTGPAKSRIHHDRIFMRRPHTQLPNTTPFCGYQSNWTVSDQTSGKSEL